MTDYPTKKVTDLPDIAQADVADDDLLLIYDTSAQGSKGYPISQLKQGSVIPLSDITSLSSLNTAALVDGQEAWLSSFWLGLRKGGGSIQWDATRPKTDHDGIEVIDPDRASEPGAVGVFNNYFVAAVSGTGCWVRPGGNKGFVPNPYHAGCVADDVIDDTIPLNQWLSKTNPVLHWKAGNYRTTGTLSKTGQFWNINGDGHFRTRINADAGTYDILSFSNGGSALSRIDLNGIMVNAGGTNRTAGSSIKFDGVLTNSNVRDIYVRHFWDAITTTGVVKSYFENIWWDQFGRSLGTKGHYGLNMEVTYNRTVDCHMTNLQGSGFLDGVEFGMVAHIHVEGCDGIYLDNSHFFWSDVILDLEPTNTGEGVICASVIVGDVYFDTTRLNHVRFGGQASSAYKSFEFGNCQFRACQESDSVLVDATGNVDLINFGGGTIFRSNKRSAIKSSQVGNVATNMTVSGVTFDDNNTDNLTVQGDIITRGTGGTFTGNTHVGGGANGHAVRLLSGSEDNLVGSNNVSKSTATSKINDGGTNNTVRNNKGFATENNGTASIADATTSITVNHGLSVTPALSDISVTATNSAAAGAGHWISNVTATTFDINTTTAPSGTTADYSWFAAVI